jgi:PAS domain S-box-containing protein
MHRQTVLVVDDDPAILEFYRKVFRADPTNGLDILGEKPHVHRSDLVCKTFEAPSKLLSWYAQAVEEGRKCPLCVLDMRMPEMDGLEVARRIRELDPEIEVVLCSAYADRSVAQMRALLDRRFYFVRKPFAPDEFMLLVDSLCVSWQRNLDRKAGEEKLRSLVDSMSDGVVYYSSAGVAEECNPAALRILKRARDEVVGRHVDAIRPLALRSDGSPYPKSERPLVRTLERGELVVDDIMGIPSPDGRITWIQLNSAPIFAPGRKRPVGAVATYSDITRHIEIERELETQKKRLSDIIDGTGVGVWEWIVPTGEFIVNEQWARIAGYTLEEISPMSIDKWVQMCHPDDRAAAKADVMHHFRDEGSHYEKENRVGHKDGGWIWVQIRGRVMERSLDGSPVRVCGTRTDITDRKNLEERLRRSSGKLEAVRRRDRELLQILSEAPLDEVQRRCLETLGGPGDDPSDSDESRGRREEGDGHAA